MHSTKTEENEVVALVEENSALPLLKELRSFVHEIKKFLKNQQNFDRSQKEQFFQCQISQNKNLSNTLQIRSTSIPDDPKSNEIVSKFLKTQKVLEKIYEDFLFEDQKLETEKLERNNEDFSNLLQEIKNLKQKDSSNIDISIFRRILTSVEKVTNSLLNIQQLPKEKQQSLIDLNLLIKEASELEKQAFVFELSEIGVLRDAQKKKEELIEQYAKEANERNDYIKALEGENQEHRGKLTETNRKYERIIKENQSLVQEIETLRVELVENKENLESKNIKYQKKIEEEKNKELGKRKEKIQDLKEKLKNSEEEMLIKLEENKRLMRELKNTENDLKSLRYEKNACQDENENLKRKLDECASQTYKTNQVNFCFGNNCIVISLRK